MKDERGVSLVELLLVVIVVGVIVFLLANLPNAMNLINKSKHLSMAREIAAKQIEDKRSISYINLVNDTLAISDSRINLLPDGSGTVVVADCDVLICTQGESAKQVSVTVSWKDNNKLQKVSLETLIAEGGLNQ